MAAQAAILDPEVPVDTSPRLRDRGETPTAGDLDETVAAVTEVRRK
jgi:hypothetical protein